MTVARQHGPLGLLEPFGGSIDLRAPLHPLYSKADLVSALFRLAGRSPAAVFGVLTALVY